MAEWAGLLAQRWAAAIADRAMPPVVLVLCGCLSPPTLAHVEVMEAARAHVQGAEGRSVVLGLLSPVPDGYAKNGLAPGADRLAMARLAARETDWLAADSWECSQSVEGRGYVPTANVLDAVQLRAEDAIDAAVDVRLVLGSDALAAWALPGPWPPAHVLRLAAHRRLVVVPRADTAPEDVRLALPQAPVLRRHAGRVALVPLPAEHAALSSSGVRARVAAGQPVDGCVAPSVARYIAGHCLYRGG